MTIQIHQPELEARIDRQMQSGAFRDMDELLTRAITALEHLPAMSGVDLDAHNMVELLEPVRGLLTDEEVDAFFARDQSLSRHLELS